MSAPGERSRLDLLRAWAEATQGLKERGLMRQASTTPVGGYAERLVAFALEAHKPQERHRSIDLVYERAGQEHRTQVKGHYVAQGSEPKRFTDIHGLVVPKRALDKPSFTELVVVLFDWDFEIRSAWMIEKALVCSMVKTPLRKSQLGIDKVERAEELGAEGIASITEDLRYAAEALD